VELMYWSMRHENKLTFILIKFCKVVYPVQHSQSMMN
jgi:hypothetical protein